MPARSASEAVEALIEPLRRAALCVTHAVPIGTGRRTTAGPNYLAFPGRLPARLSGDTRFGLFLSYSYEVVRVGFGRESWTADAIGYVYELLDAAGQRVLAYHWHPDGRSRVTAPHLHTRQLLPIDISRTHPPTGRVSLPAVLRYAIVELGGEPMRGDWASILDLTEQASQRSRSTE